MINKPKRKRRDEEDHEAEEDSEDEEARPLQQPQKKQKSPKAPSSRPALMQAPFAPRRRRTIPGAPKTGQAERVRGALALEVAEVGAIRTSL